MPRFCRTGRAKAPGAQGRDDRGTTLVEVITAVVLLSVFSAAALVA
ncbi:MAG: prepilin-type N-terminal cleavage/methylation domain-containing protein, partial [Bifidobacteriaceae bacterium]|nr:prepilin-type N-terminal cleavage/methylation domain-containing protein [Bifidobacteriaceae bacterium]